MFTYTILTREDLLFKSKFLIMAEVNVNLDLAKAIVIVNVID
ncbi:hypothetical protein [Methanobrevibacter sp.]